MIGEYSAKGQLVVNDAMSVDNLTMGINKSILTRKGVKEKNMRDTH